MDKAAAEFYPEILCSNSQKVSGKSAKNWMKLKEVSDLDFSYVWGLQIQSIGHSCKHPSNISLLYVDRLYLMRKSIAFISHHFPFQR